MGLGFNMVQPHVNTRTFTRLLGDAKRLSPDAEFWISCEAWQQIHGRHETSGCLLESLGLRIGLMVRDSSGSHSLMLYWTTGPFTGEQECRLSLGEPGDSMAHEVVARPFTLLQKTGFMV